MRKIAIYDTTLRDGMQSERINFNVNDKIKILKKLNDFGVAYIEGGWPGASDIDTEFFEKAKDISIQNSKFAAFGSTRRINTEPSNDVMLNNLIKAETPVVTIFGKSWDFHVSEVLKISLEDNLDMIRDSIKYLKSFGKEVIFDAEHFFDGYLNNMEYAMQTIKVAREAGATWISLCETNGGALSDFVYKATKHAYKELGDCIGIHCHNDSGLAVSNSIAAVQAGASMVQGTINGYGERCGNANLCIVIPLLETKLGFKCLSKQNLEKITSISAYIDDVANIIPDDKMPFVGNSAFAHKAGIHADAVVKNPNTYEHIAPELVGNNRKITISSYSGASNIVDRLKKYGIHATKRSLEVRNLLNTISRLESDGYSFEEATASFDLIILKEFGVYEPFFEPIKFRVTGGEITSDENQLAEAVLKIRVGEGEAYTVAEGDGPVHALDIALRKALKQFYGEEISRMTLTDYKVRVVISRRTSTSSKVRVIIETRDCEEVWYTIGVSNDIIKASWYALVDSIEYGLYKYQNKQ